MSNTYYSGLPCSDELQHYGIVGMKWGVRRFQNKDGTRTEAGKKRYRKSNEAERILESVKSGMTDAGRIVGRTTAHAGRRFAEGISRGIKEKLAEKYPFMLNDEELMRYNERQRLENMYLNSRADKRAANQKNRKESFGAELAKNAVRNTANIVVNKTVNKAMDRLLETDDERELREATTEKNKYEEQSKARLNKLNDTISDNDMINQRDYKRMQDLNDKANSVAGDIKLRNAHIKDSKTSNTRKSSLQAQNIVDKQRLKKMQKESSDLLDEIKRRSQQNDRARAALKSVGFSSYDNSGKAGKGNNKLSKEDLSQLAEILRNYDDD